MREKYEYMCDRFAFSKIPNPFRRLFPSKKTVQMRETYDNLHEDIDFLIDEFIKEKQSCDLQIKSWHIIPGGPGISPS